jgi:hypothetical protein
VERYTEAGPDYWEIILLNLMVMWYLFIYQKALQLAADVLKARR